MFFVYYDTSKDKNIKNKGMHTMSMLKKMFTKKSVITAEELEKERMEFEKNDALIVERKNQLEQKNEKIESLTEQLSSIVSKQEAQHPKLQEAKQEVEFLKEEKKRIEEQLKIAGENVSFLETEYTSLSNEKAILKQEKEKSVIDYEKEKDLLLKDLLLHDDKTKKLQAKVNEFQLQQKEKELEEKENQAIKPGKRQGTTLLNSARVRVMETEKFEKPSVNQVTQTGHEGSETQVTQRVATANILSFKREETPVVEKEETLLSIQPMVQQETIEPVMNQYIEVLSNAPILEDENIAKVRESMNYLAQNISLYPNGIEGFSFNDDTDDDTIMFAVKIRVREPQQNLMTSEWYNFELKLPFDQLKVQFIDEGTLMDIGYEVDENCLELEDPSDLPNVTKALHNAQNTLKFFISKKKTLA